MKSLAHPAHDQDENHPRACYEGVVYIGHRVEGEEGEETEVIEAVRCRRCEEKR